MSIFFPPPPPFMGAAQPYAGRHLPPSVTAVRVDAPPTTLGGPVAIPATIVTRWQPDPWVYLELAQGVFKPRVLTPGIPGQSIDNPVPRHPGRDPRTAAIVVSWQPDPWIYAPLARQAYEARKLSPAIPGQSISAPIPKLGGPVTIPAEIVARWQPDPWVFDIIGFGQPYGARQNSPAVPGQSKDPPPFQYGGPYALKADQLTIAQGQWGYSPWPYDFIGSRQPYGERTNTPRLISVPVDDPPYTHAGRRPVSAEIAQSWQPPPPFFHLTLYAPRPTPQRLRPTARGYVIL